MAILSAPADSAVQTFIYVTVPFIRVVSTIISAITEAPLRDAAAVGAHEEGTVTQASWEMQDMAHYCQNCPQVPNKAKEHHIDMTMELDRLIPFKKSSCGSSAFCLGHMFPAVSWESSAAADTNEEIPAESQTVVLPAARHLRFRGSSSEWSGQSA